MAAPHVSGTAALVIASNQALPISTADVRLLLQATADDLYTAGRDVRTGFGLVDARQSITGVQTNP
jgi:serine protease